MGGDPPGRAFRRFALCWGPQSQSAVIDVGWGRAGAGEFESAPHNKRLSMRPSLSRPSRHLSRHLRHRPSPSRHRRLLPALRRRPSRHPRALMSSATAARYLRPAASSSMWDADGCLELHVGCRARCQTKLLTPDVRRQKEAITVHLLEQGWLGTRLVVVQAQQWPLFRVEVHR